jgi:hypothetical protein
MNSSIPFNSVIMKVGVALLKWSVPIYLICIRGLRKIISRIIFKNRRWVDKGKADLQNIYFKSS